MKIGGRMVIPVGDEPTSQDLIRVVRNSNGGYDTEYLTGVRFVPLIGSEGWAPGTA
jgi:protein-L-isoaspartate(D-aspartate) O-methyltransferase